MSIAEESVISAVKRYLAALSAVGIHASKAVLFGSFARGRPIVEIARQEGIIIAA
jgi:predicted nucleotidyltransferase